MIKKYTNYSLLAHNTFGIDVNADIFIEYSSIEDLKEILRSEDLKNKNCLHIGAGSNLLFASDFTGIILHSAISGIEIIEETDDYVILRTGAGVVWDDFVIDAVKHGWYGAENLSLIPGEVGASAVQNIGAYGVEIKDILVKVETIEIETGLTHLFSCADCQFSYRQSIFKGSLKNKHIVTHVTYRLNKIPTYKLEYGNIKTELEAYEENLNLQIVRDAIINIRNAKLPDPKLEGNAGSFFMNPVVSREKFDKLKSDYPDMPFYNIDSDSVKIPAAWMIDCCGWKGKTLGHVGVHQRQALVLVNKGGATGKEVMKLAEEIRRTVREKFGIDIHPEVNYIEC